MFVCGSLYVNSHLEEIMEPKMVATSNFAVVEVAAAGQFTFALIDNPHHNNLDIALMNRSFRLEKIEKEVSFRFSRI